MLECCLCLWVTVNAVWNAYIVCFFFFTKQTQSQKSHTDTYRTCAPACSFSKYIYNFTFETSTLYGHLLTPFWPHINRYSNTHTHMETYMLHPHISSKMLNSTFPSIIHRLTVSQIFTRSGNSSVVLFLPFLLGGRAGFKNLASCRSFTEITEYQQRSAVAYRSPGCF